MISTIRLWDTPTGPGAASTRQVRDSGMVTLGAPEAALALLITIIKSSQIGVSWEETFQVI